MVWGHMAHQTLQIQWFDGPLAHQTLHIQWFGQIAHKILQIHSFENQWLAKRYVYKRLRTHGSPNLTKIIVFNVFQCFSMFSMLFLFSISSIFQVFPVFNVLHVLPV